MASKNDPLIVAAISIIFGVALIYLELKNFRKARKIQDLARIDIASAPQGLVELEGYAWPRINSLQAVCGREVVYYNYKVEQLVKHGKSSSWVTKFEFDYEKPFFVIDSSGVCVVQPIKNCVDIVETHRKLSGYAEDITALRGCLAKVGFFAALFKGSYRLAEKKILVGSPIYICGELVAYNGPAQKISGDYKKFLQNIKTIKINPVFKMQKFDFNRDGKITEEEMTEGISNEAVKTGQALVADAVKIAGVIANSETHPMILADCHQDQLLKRLSSYIYLKLAAGIALIALGVFILQK